MSFITEATKGTGVLFNVPENERKQDGPIMTGSVEIDQQRYYISGFLREATTEGANNYLSLQITSPLPENYTDADLAAQLRYFGKLFKQTNKQYENSPDYSGYIQVLGTVKGDHRTDEEWDNCPQLQIVGEARRNMGDGGARINIRFAPRKIAAGELNF